MKIEPKEIPSLFFSPPSDCIYLVTCFGVRYVILSLTFKLNIGTFIPQGIYCTVYMLTSELNFNHQNFILE